eukprot:4580469-Lingulodinium_polyedra.AAC.1
MDNTHATSRAQPQRQCARQTRLLDNVLAMGVPLRSNPLQSINSVVKSVSTRWSTPYQLGGQI